MEYTTPIHSCILPLADVPEAIPVLTQWFLAEWEPYYGPNGSGDAEGDLKACCDGSGIPLALVAKDAKGAILGTAALKPRSMESHPHLGPWLAALLVAPAARRKKVASALVAAIEEAARKRNYDALYCGTDGAIADLLHGRGWKPLEEGAPTLRDPATIYCLCLK